MGDFFDFLLDLVSDDENESTSQEDFVRKMELKTAAVRPKIVDVIFNAPATIVKWSDNTKTVVKCGDGDKYDREKGLAFAIAKKYYGNVGDWYGNMDKWLSKPEKKEEKKSADKKPKKTYIKVNGSDIDVDDLKAILGLAW